eukprot:2540251-Ditylum_brightwellii.AAC.1
MVLAHAYTTKEIMYGRFVSTEMHWQSSLAMLKDPLKKQSTFFNTVNDITIEGLAMEALDIKINMNNEEKTLRAYMCENNILQIK